MRSIVTTVIFSALVIQHIQAQTTINGSFDHDGQTRTYSYYVPASYVPGDAVPLVINLHGLGTDGTYQAQYRDFRPFADTANFIVAHPDGTTLFAQHFWNYGNVLGSTVDDIGFLEALIDTISAQYSINPQRVYCAGVSNGSFMSYYMACQSDRFAAIGAVTGSMSVDMYNACTPNYPMPVIHIHGTADGTNPYTGTSTMIGIEETVRYWVNENDCDTVPLITAVPDINTTDNATAERYLYTGGIDGHTVEHFKVTGGGHTWPGSPIPGSTNAICMDFDATAELWRFFSQYERTSVSSVKPYDAVKLSLWPNPARSNVYVRSDRPIKSVRIIDLQGREIVRNKLISQTVLDVSNLTTGTYIVEVAGTDFSVRQKLFVTR